MPLNLVQCNYAVECVLPQEKHAAAFGGMPVTWARRIIHKSNAKFLFHNSNISFSFP